MFLKVNLNKITNISEFVAIASKAIYPVTLSSSLHTVNAKSIMGVFSLDLSKPLTVEFDDRDAELLVEFNKYKIIE